MHAGAGICNPVLEVCVWGVCPGARWSGICNPALERRRGGGSRGSLIRQTIGELQVGGLITAKPQMDRKVDLPDKELIHIANPLVSTTLTLQGTDLQMEPSIR